MSTDVDWPWKIREAIERVKTRYDHIGRNTGASFLAVVYPPDAEAAVLKEWHTQLAGRSARSSRFTRSTSSRSRWPFLMNSEARTSFRQSLSRCWIKSRIRPGQYVEWNAVATAVRERSAKEGVKRPIVVLERTGALFPAASPRAVMQQLWDSGQSALDGPARRPNSRNTD